jgi:hypothetical protein
VDIDYARVPASDTSAFNLTVTDPAGNTETFANVTTDSSKPNYVLPVVNDEDNGSQLVRVAVPQGASGRPPQTGTVGTALTFTAGGGLQGLTANTAYALKMTLNIPAVPAAGNTPAKPASTVDVNVPLLDVADKAPSSLAGFCSLLQRKANQALQATQPPTSVSCVPSDGGGIRVIASVRNWPDATVTFAAPAAPDGSALLGLTGATVNVTHFAVGNPRQGNLPGSNGTTLPQTGDLIGDPAKFTGIFALEKVDLFNILCIPDATRASTSDPKGLDTGLDPNSVFSAAMDYCKQRRAFLLVDPPPSVADVSSAVDWKTSGLKVHDLNGAAYFPRLRLPDPLNSFQLRSFAPCGVIAGLFARTDANRGVWKAPAGVEATLNGVQALVYKLTDNENGALNPLGLNCARVFPVYGPVCWGARTLVGSDTEGSEWKYVPVRRLALFLEESLYRGTKWAVFEPNDEPLWAQLRLNIGAFMQNLYRQGAFQGTTPAQAYFVKCDKENTTQNDINLGVVNIIVGFAPLKPAEFVVITIQQIAGAIQT